MRIDLLPLQMNGVTESRGILEVARSFRNDSRGSVSALQQCAQFINHQAGLPDDAPQRAFGED